MDESTEIELFEENCTLAPISSNNLDIVIESDKVGTFEILMLPLFRIAAAIRGRTAFFAPLTSTKPLSFFNPLISK